MRHARKDYERFQDPEGKIPADEPVFIVRAQDECGPGTVRAWGELAKMAGVDQEMIDRVMEHADDMESWQTLHGSKTPDIPEGS